MTGRVEIKLLGLNPIIVRNNGSSYDITWNELSVNLSETQLNGLINILTVKKDETDPVIRNGKRVGQRKSLVFDGKTLEFNDFQLEQIIAALEKVKTL